MAQATTHERQAVPTLSPDVPAYREMPPLQISEGTEHMVRMEIENPEVFRLTRDEHGKATIRLAAARLLECVTDMAESLEVSEAVLLMSEHIEFSGWTSLHVSTIKNDSAILEYILNQVKDKEKRQAFIDEVDREFGWTSLQWGAALDKVEAVETTMSHMSTSHQQKVMTSGWTLLHATAKTDAVNTMRSLMNRFEMTEEEKWKILTCPAADGKTALHIAVAEGNARAAIMLLDLAGPKKSQLSAQKDESGKSTLDYANDFSLLGKYVSLAIEFEEPVIHMAARRNDRFLVSWILDQYSCPMPQVINQRNEDESTVLHAASEGNSPEVIKEIALKLGQKDFFNSLHERNKNGESVIHNSVVKNHPSCTHAILSSVSTKKGRKSMLQLQNGQGEDIAALAEKLKHEKVKDTIKYHGMMLSSLSSFFKNFEYSLFSIKIPPERLNLRYKRIEQLQEEDRGLVRHANFDATTCILYGNTFGGNRKNSSFVRAEELTASAVKVDGANIHTWCNRGVLKLKKNQLEDAESAAFKVVELIASDSVYSQLLPRINYAYWSAEVLRTEEARETCCKIMEQCEEQTRGDNVTQEFLSYCFLKILVRQLRSDDKHNKPNEWYRKKLSKAIDQLVVLSKSKNEEHQADMWLWLVEIRIIDIPPDYLNTHLERFRRETGIDNIDPEYCHGKIEKLVDDEKHKLERKIRARIAKNYLHLAYHCDDDKEQADAELKMKFFDKAVDLSEKWINDNEWVFMCASTCAQGLLNIWAIKFFEEHEDLVREHYQRLYRKELRTKREAWQFLTSYFYCSDITSDQTTREYLRRVKQHLIKIMEHADGWTSHGVKYARVKHLLGDSPRSVEQALERAEEAAEGEFRQLKVKEQRGCFYLSIREHEKAKNQFEIVGEVRDDFPASKIAKGALHWIRHVTSELPTSFWTGERDYIH